MKQYEEWIPPKTIKVYLHPPFSERLVLLWPDFKVTNYEFADNGKHTRQNSTGLIILHGREMEQFNFRDTIFSPVNDGLPIYKMNNHGECDISMEGFCNFDKNPSAFIQITLNNNNAYTIKNCLNVLARSGDDAYLSNIFDTGYTPYEPNVGTWYLLRRNWSHTGYQMTDGYGYVQIQPGKNMQVDWIGQDSEKGKFDACNYFRISYKLEPGESTSIIISQKYDNYTETINYNHELAKAIAEWKKIHKKISVWPMIDNIVYRKIYLQLITQSLQMLASLPGKDMIIPRQGDIACFVWPWEAMHFLIPLDKIGLSDYTKKAYKYFVERWCVEGGVDDGKIKSDNQQWGNLNGSFIWGVSEHLKITDSREDFNYFKPYLDRALDWIQRERKKSELEEGYKDIFPAGKATDWYHVAQHWCFTDGTNVMALGHLAELYEMFEAEDAQYVRGIYNEYRAILLNIAQSLYQGHENDDAYILPHQLGILFEETELYCYFLSGHPYLYLLDILDPNTKMFEQLENYFQKNGFFDNGLTGRMTSLHPASPGLYAEMYYIVTPEMMWIKAWKQRGEMGKAQKTLHSLFKYGMTSEYIVAERYSPKNPWFSPWQPNASSTGRILSIMLDYFGVAEGSK